MVLSRVNTILFCFYFLAFYFEIIFDLQKSYKNSIESSHIHFTQLTLKMLTYCMIQPVKTKKLVLVQCYKLQDLLILYHIFTVIVLFQDTIQDHLILFNSEFNGNVSLVSSNLSLDLSLSFMTLVLLKSPDQLFCRLSLSFGQSDVFSSLRIQVRDLGKSNTKLMLPFRCILSPGSMKFIYCITGGFHFAYLVDIVSMGFLHGEVIGFPLCN